MNLFKSKIAPVVLLCSAAAFGDLDRWGLEIIAPTYTTESIRIQSNFTFGNFTLSPGSYSYINVNGKSYHSLDPIFGVCLFAAYAAFDSESEQGVPFGTFIGLIILSIIQAPNIQYTLPWNFYNVRLFASTNYNLFARDYLYRINEHRFAGSMNIGLRSAFREFYGGISIGVTNISSYSDMPLVLRASVGYNLPIEWIKKGKINKQ